MVCGTSQRHERGRAVARLTAGADCASATHAARSGSRTVDRAARGRHAITGQLRAPHRRGSRLPSRAGYHFVRQPAAGHVSGRSTPSRILRPTARAAARHARRARVGMVQTIPIRSDYTGAARRSRDLCPRVVVGVHNRARSRVHEDAFDLSGGVREHAGRPCQTCPALQRQNDEFLLAVGTDYAIPGSREDDGCPRRADLWRGVNGDA